MAGKLSVGNQIRTTHFRFRNITDYEHYFNAFDEGGYEPDEAIFSGYIGRKDALQFCSVNRSQYGNCCDFEHEIIEYRGNNCYISTKCYCFIKCINHLTGEDYKKQYLIFLRSEKRRSDIMSIARVQP